MLKRISDQFKQSAAQIVSAEHPVAQVAQQVGIGHSTKSKSAFVGLSVK